MNKKDLQTQLEEAKQLLGAVIINRQSKYNLSWSELTVKIDEFLRDDNG